MTTWARSPGEARQSGPGGDGVAQRRQDLMPVTHYRSISSTAFGCVRILDQQLTLALVLDQGAYPTGRGVS
jgi:hypothetical protein